MKEKLKELEIGEFIKLRLKTAPMKISKHYLLRLNFAKNVRNGQPPKEYSTPNL